MDSAEVRAIKEIAKELAKLRKELTLLRRELRNVEGDDEEDCED